MKTNILSNFKGDLTVNTVRIYFSDSTSADISNGGIYSFTGKDTREFRFYFRGGSYCQNPTDIATFYGYIKSNSLGYLGQSTTLSMAGATLTNGADKPIGTCKTTVTCGSGNVAGTYSGDSNVKPFQSASTCSFQADCELNPGETISCSNNANQLIFPFALNGGNTSSDVEIYLSPWWYNNFSYDKGIYEAISGLRDEQSSTNDKIDETNDKLDDLNESITDSDISGASDSAGGFFTDFENDDYGLSDIVTLPLTFIQGLANASCSDLELPLPFVDEDVLLPCMSAIYEDYFGPFLTIYQIITFGIVGYWVCVNTLRLVNNFKNPDNDEVEVMDL